MSQQTPEAPVPDDGVPETRPYDDGTPQDDMSDEELEL